LVAQDAKIAKDIILESREKAAFQKTAASCRDAKCIAVRRKAFWLPPCSSGKQKLLLGVPRAFSEASGSFHSPFISTFESLAHELGSLRATPALAHYCRSSGWSLISE
jgi:hypothetical protein